jgi:hypothetical protein
MRSIAIGAVLLSLACAKEAAQNTDTVSAAAGTPAVVPPPIAGTFAAADFAKLRWLEGKWRGFMPDGGKFYESYTWDNDSTIVKHSYADSTFTNPTDRSVIQLRGTTVADESEKARWVVTRIDSTGADFAPERGANNHFTFTREDATKWNASLRWTENGQPKTVVYALHRFGR